VNAHRITNRDRCGQAPRIGGGFPVRRADAGSIDDAAPRGRSAAVSLPSPERLETFWAGARLSPILLIPTR